MWAKGSIKPMKGVLQKYTLLNCPPIAINFAVKNTLTIPMFIFFSETPLLFLKIS